MQPLPSAKTDSAIFSDGLVPNDFLLKIPNKLGILLLFYLLKSACPAIHEYTHVYKSIYNGTFFSFVLLNVAT